MLTPITVKTYNKLLSKEKTLIEMFFEIGISLAIRHPKEDYVNTLILSLAEFTDLNEANIHIKQIQDFYNSSIETFEALTDEKKGADCDKVIDTLFSLYSFEKTRETLHSASENMLEVLINEFDLHDAMELYLYGDVVEQVGNKFENNPFYAEQFLSLLDTNTMLRKNKGADKDDCEDFIYKMYAICQYFNDYRKDNLEETEPASLDLQSIPKQYTEKMKKLFDLGEKEVWNKRFSYVKNLGLSIKDKKELLSLGENIDIYNEENVTQENENVFYAIMHAWKALAELKIIEAKPLFVFLLLNAGNDDWMGENFPNMYSVYGDHAEAFTYIINEDLDEHTRWSFVYSLTLMYKNNLIEKKAFVNYINKALMVVQDGVVNGALISECLDHKLTETYLNIVSVYTKGMVDYDICGDLEDVEMEFGMRDKRSTEKSDSYLLEAEPISPIISNIGRNDPCLCGSGKKYKKCCINEI